MTSSARPSVVILTDDHEVCDSMLVGMRRAAARALRDSRDAHGGVPFDRKDTWRQGYDEARWAVLRELDAYLATARKGLQP